MSKLFKIECESCGARFNVPNTEISPEGRLVQCSHCGHEWMVQAPTLPIFESSPLSQSSQARAMGDDQVMASAQQPFPASVSPGGLQREVEAGTGTKQQDRDKTNANASSSSTPNAASTAPQLTNIVPGSHKTLMHHSRGGNRNFEQPQPPSSRSTPPSMHGASHTHTHSHKPGSDRSASAIHVLIVNLVMSALIIFGYRLYHLAVENERPILHQLLDTVGVDFHYRDHQITISNVRREEVRMPYPQMVLHVELVNRNPSAEIVKSIDVEYFSVNRTVSKSHIKVRRILKPGEARLFVVHAPSIEHHLADSIRISVNKRVMLGKTELDSVTQLQK